MNDELWLKLYQSRSKIFYLSLIKTRPIFEVVIIYHHIIFSTKYFCLLIKLESRHKGTDDGWLYDLSIMITWKPVRKNDVNQFSLILYLFLKHLSRWTKTNQAEKRYFMPQKTNKCVTSMIPNSTSKFYNMMLRELLDI